MMDWTLGVEDIIYSFLIAKFPKTLKSKYPNINFATIKEGTPASFPTVYVTVTSSDIGKTLDGTHINAVNTRLQIDVLSNKSKSEAKEIMGGLMEVVKEMGFTFSQIPNFEKESTYYRSILVGTRVIGSSDIL